MAQASHSMHTQREGQGGGGGKQVWAGGESDLNEGGVVLYLHISMNNVTEVSGLVH